MALCHVRGTATGADVREELGMQGLLPPRQSTLQLEIDRAWAAISRCCTRLDKYQVREFLLRMMHLLLQQTCRLLHATL